MTAPREEPSNPGRELPIPRPKKVGSRARKELRDGVLRAHGRAPTYPLEPGHARAARRAGWSEAQPESEARERRPGRAARRAQGGVRAPRCKVHRDPGEELVGLLSGVRALQPGKPQDPSGVPVPRVRAYRKRRRQCGEEPPPVRDIAGTQGRGQAVLGGVRSCEAPSWRGQPGQGTGGKPGQRPGAATGPRAKADPASRKGLSARRPGGCKGERVRGSSTCGNQGACHLLMGDYVGKCRSALTQGAASAGGWGTYERSGRG